VGGVEGGGRRRWCVELRTKYVCRMYTHVCRMCTQCICMCTVYMYVATCIDKWSRDTSIATPTIEIVVIIVKALLMTTALFVNVILACTCLWRYSHAPALSSSRWSTTVKHPPKYARCARQMKRNLTRAIQEPTATTPPPPHARGFFPPPPPPPPLPHRGGEAKSSIAAPLLRSCPALRPAPGLHTGLR
jgi:hypothetical protein